MTIIEIAGMLGDAIKADERAVTMAQAEQAYQSDETLLGYINEYNAQQAALSEEYGKDNKDGEMVAAIQKRIDELYSAITENPVYVAYTEAEHALNALMSEVNSEINFRITGERPCTHDCSTCGGCH